MYGKQDNIKLLWLNIICKCSRGKRSADSLAENESGGRVLDENWFKLFGQRIRSLENR
jgi:hypothetical protein